MLASMGKSLQVGVLIDVDFDVLMKRLTGRRTCKSCGQMYNVHFQPPRVPGRCDKCGGELMQRGDDNEATISNRLRVYESQTAPLVDYYRRQGKLRTVQGVGEVSSIFDAVKRVVEGLPAGGVTQEAAKPAATKPARKKTATKKKTSKVKSQKTNNK